MLLERSSEELSTKLTGIPVIVVCTESSVLDTMGLLLGGTADYLTKPFGAKELAARVAMRLRESPFPHTTVLRSGELAPDISSHEVRIGDMPVLLTRMEYAILKQLMKHPGQAITKSVLLDRIREDTPACTGTSLKTHISNLRSKLRQASGNDYIEAIGGIRPNVQP